MASSFLDLEVPVFINRSIGKRNIKGWMKLSKSVDRVLKKPKAKKNPLTPKKGEANVSHDLIVFIDFFPNSTLILQATLPQTSQSTEDGINETTKPDR
jgi:hypothetical protein